MHDYDAEYRRLRAAGLSGWAGQKHERNVAHMAETLARLSGRELSASGFYAQDTRLRVNP